MNLFKNKRREKEDVIIFGKPASGRVLIRPISENEGKKNPKIKFLEYGIQTQIPNAN